MSRSWLILFLLGCQQHEPPAPVVQAPEPSVPTPVAEHTPFLIKNRISTETGTLIRELPEVSHWEFAIPDGPHRFRIGEYLVDTKADSVTPAPPPVRFTSAGEAATLVRTDPDGSARWTNRLTGVRSVRPPDVDVGGGKVVATIDTTIHAFDDVTGKQVWQSHVEGDRLHIVGATVYSTMCNEPTNDHWLIGTALADGRELFRAALWDKCDPSLSFVNNFVIAVGDKHTQILDLGGHTLMNLDEEATAIAGPSHTTVLATETQLMEIDDHAHVVWKHAPLSNSFVDGNVLAELPNGDIVIANFGQIDDSGADLIRLTKNGTEVWHAHASGLGVAHSEYEHRVYIEVRDDKLFVISQGSGGAFLERRSLGNGARDLRCIVGEKCISFE